MTELVWSRPSRLTFFHCLTAWLCSLLMRFWRDSQAVVGLSPHSLLLLGASCVFVGGASVVLPLACSRLYSHRISVAADGNADRVGRRHGSSVGARV